MVENSPSVHWGTTSANYGFITTRFYTIQRVNGTGPNGKEEGAGAHRHNLNDSDKIKKNSVVRWLAKGNKEAPKRKVQVCTGDIYHVLQRLARSWRSSRGTISSCIVDYSCHLDLLISTLVNLLYYPFLFAACQSVLLVLLSLLDCGLVVLAKTRAFSHSV